MKSIVLQKFANREIRIGWQDFASRRPSAGDTPNDIQNERVNYHVANSADAIDDIDRLSPLLRTNPIYKTAFADWNYGDRAESLKRSLDITSKFRRCELEAKPKKKILHKVHRKTVFGKNARHTLLEAGSVAEAFAKKPQNSAILTLTLPGGTKDAFKTLAQYSGYVCDRLFRMLRKPGTPIRWFYVWEFQKRGALHMHLCLSSQVEGKAMEMGRVLRNKWIEVLQDVGDKSGVCMFQHQRGLYCTISQNWQNDLQECKKSVAAYFTKYASKQADSAKRGFDGKPISHDYYPSRWWGCQRQLRQEIENERFSIRLEGVTEDEVANLLIFADKWCNGHNPIMRYRYDFEVGYISHGKNRPLGYGERHVIYFDDDSFLHICNELPDMCKQLLGMVDAPYVQCNRMSAIKSA